MKTLLLIVSAFLLATQLATATSYVRIGILQGDTNTLLTIQDIPVTPERLQEMMAKVASLDVSQIIVVSVDSRTPAEYVLSTLSLIKDLGLRNVCVVPQHGRDELDVLSLQARPKTNKFIQFYYADPDGIDDLLNKLAPIESKDKWGEQSVPGYPPQGVGYPATVTLDVKI